MSDEKETWKQIVASFDETPSGEQPWPDIENVPSSETDEPESGIALLDDDMALDVEADEDDDDEEAADPPEDHYEPPPPPPLPRLDPVTKGAWLALFGGPVYLLLSVILGWRAPGWLAFLAVVAFIGGFVTLIVRMGDSGSGHDDGAVV